MDPLTILGAVAAVAQLLEATHIVAGGIITLIHRNREIPEKIRRLKRTLQSLRAKLEILARTFTDPAQKLWLSRDLCDNFKISLLQVHSDIEAVADIIKNYDMEIRRTTLVRTKLRYQLYDQRALSKCKQHLESSVENLQCMESSIHICMTSAIHQEICVRTKEDHQERDIQHIPHLTHWNIRSRYSFLRSGPYMRNHSVYCHIIKEAHKDDKDSQSTVCLGVCFPSWLMLPPISLVFILIAAFLNNEWRIQWGLRVQFRVPMTSPLMKACENGDVALISQIMRDGNGGINDRSMCGGKTPLLIAINRERFEAVEYLLEHGADPNIPDDDQVLPLFAVAGMDPSAHSPLEQLPPRWNRWLEAFRLLIKHRAFVFETVRGRNLAGLNVDRDQLPSRTLEYLRLLAALDSPQLDVMFGRQCWSALHNAFRCKSDSLDALKLLHSCHICLSKIMEDGRTSLHFAAEMCTSPETLEFLCANGCSEHINRHDQWGWMPLHYAVVGRRSAECLPPYSNAVILLRKGADPTLKGSSNDAYIYHQPTEPFTAFELLRHVRPERYILLEHVLKNAGFESFFAEEEDIT